MSDWIRPSCHCAPTVIAVRVHVVVFLLSSQTALISDPVPHDCGTNSRHAIAAHTNAKLI